MIIVQASHLDHNLSVGQLDFIKTKFEDRKEFFKETFELPAHLGSVEVSLIGPAVGGQPIPEDAVTYVIRDGRKWTSRVHKHSPSILDEQYRAEAGLTGLIGFGNDDGERIADVKERVAEDAYRKPHSRLVTVIAGPHGDHPCVLYTAYGGPEAPREPGDINIASWDELTASRGFWALHALVW